MKTLGVPVCLGRAARLRRDRLHWAANKNLGRHFVAAPRTTTESLFEGDVHFGIAARCGQVHHRGYAFKVQSYACPFRRTGQHHNGNLSAGEVLLVANPLVGGQKQVNCGILRRL